MGLSTLLFLTCLVNADAEIVRARAGLNQYYSGIAALQVQGTKHYELRADVSQELKDLHIRAVAEEHRAQEESYKKLGNLGLRPAARRSPLRLEDPQPEVGFDFLETRGQGRFKTTGNDPHDGKRYETTVYFENGATTTLRAGSNVVEIDPEFDGSWLPISPVHAIGFRVQGFPVEMSLAALLGDEVPVTNKGKSVVNGHESIQLEIGPKLPKKFRSRFRDENFRITVFLAPALSYLPVRQIHHIVVRNPGLHGETKTLVKQIDLFEIGPAKEQKGGGALPFPRRFVLKDGDIFQQIWKIAGTPTINPVVGEADFSPELPRNPIMQFKGLPPVPVPIERAPQNRQNLAT